MSIHVPSPLIRVLHFNTNPYFIEKQKQVEPTSVDSHPKATGLLVSLPLFCFFLLFQCTNDPTLPKANPPLPLPRGHPLSAGS